jgi:Holliday junction resolvase RusA-like endonuclease
MIRIRVVGEPAPQGSKSFKGKRGAGIGIMVESSKKVAPWRESVAGAAIDQTTIEQRGLEGPLAVHMAFILLQPVSLSKKKVALGPYRKPDLSKLVRSTEDALTTAGVWRDDAQVVSCTASKRFARPGEALGAELWIESAALIDLFRLPASPEQLAQEDADDLEQRTRQEERR